MRIAESMKSITEDIIASHDLRVKTLKDLTVDTRRTIRGFAADRKKMSEEQAKDLADFVADLSKNVGNMIKGFQKGSLDKGETDRLKAFKGMMGDIRKDINDIETYVKNKLKEFSDTHAEMSEQQRKDLANYVRGIVNEVKKLLSEYGSDMAKARAVWQGMATSLAKSRKGGVMSRIEAGERATTVEEAIEKKPRKKEEEKRKDK